MSAKSLQKFIPLMFLLFACRNNHNATINQNQAPNIIYIYADDLGYGETQPYGQDKIKTPILSKMASEGILFSSHYTSSPVCAPARASLLTGLHTGHSFVRGNREKGNFADDEERGQEPLPEGTVTIGTLLQEAGYKTGAIGKWGLGMTGNTGHPNKQGFDYFYGYLDQKQAHNYYPTHLWENDRWDTLNNPYIYVHAARRANHDQKALADFEASHLKPADSGFFDAYRGNDYSIDRLTAHALGFIRENKGNPFFLYLPYTIPHVSLQVPDSALQHYRGQFQEKPYLSEQGYAPHEYPKSAYAAMISYLDGEVGKIFNLLKDLGLDENTLVIFSSDNGPTFNGGVDATFFNSAAGFRGLKMDLYEGGIRMPMIARWPGKIEAGSSTDHISAHYDVLATLADIAGINPPESTDGISFLPSLLGRNDEQRRHEYLYFEYPEKRGQLAIRMGKWKAVKTEMIPNPDGPWQLYDLEEDPAEYNDVAGQYPELIEKFDEIVKIEHRSSHVSGWNFVERTMND